MFKRIEYIDDKRLSTDWYDIANKYTKLNDSNIFNPSHKFYTWDDVWKEVKDTIIKYTPNVVGISSKSQN